MIRRLLVASLASLLSAGAAVADTYVAISNTAMSITGDVEFDDAGITFANGESLAFSRLLGDQFIVGGDRVPASVYEIESPADPELENGNRLCGSGEVKYLATWMSGEDTTTIAVFTGNTPPSSDADMCASYLYENPG